MPIQAQTDQSAIPSVRRALLLSTLRLKSLAPAAGLLAVAALAFAVYRLTPAAPPTVRVTVWLAIAAILAIVLRLARVKVFGPVLFYDLIRVARKRRILIDRLAYAAILFFVVWISFEVFEQARQPFARSAASAKDLARFAESFFLTFSLVQFGIVGFVTPVYAAGAIAEEKERRTLEFVLATDLSNREIVLSKLVSRLATLLLLLLTGLPVLATIQFLGGVDPDLVLAAFAATAFMGLGLASVSVLCSVYAKRARTAVLMTYLLMLGYVCLTGVLAGAESGFPTFFGTALTGGPTPVTVRDVADWLSAGNVFLMVGRLAQGLATQSSLAGVLGEIATEYVIFYSALAAICATWAVARVRAVALGETAVKQPRKRRGWLRGRWRPAVTDQPMVWKEVYAEPGLHLNWAGRAVVLLVAGISLAPIVVTVVAYDAGMAAAWAMPYHFSLAQQLNPTIRMVGTSVACLLLLGVALRASGSVTGERERQTFDDLLTTPLTNAEILFGKWLGSALGVRTGWIWLGSIWMIGFVTGALHPLGFLFLVTAWFVYAGVAAALGLGISVRQRSTPRANLRVFGALFCLGCGHWLIWIPMLFCLFGPGGRDAAGLFEHIAKFQAFALTPPVALFAMTWPLELAPSRYGGSEPEVAITVYALVGLFIWAGVAVALFRSAETRFRRITGRERSPLGLPAPQAPRSQSPTAP